MREPIWTEVNQPKCSMGVYVELTGGKISFRLVAVVEYDIFRFRGPSDLMHGAQLGGQKVTWYNINGQPNLHFLFITSILEVVPLDFVSLPWYEIRRKIIVIGTIHRSIHMNFSRFPLLQASE